MLQSMTGFGSAQLETEHYRVTIEVRTLNSKSLDLVLKQPKLLSDSEQEIRQMITRSLNRGRVAVNIDAQPKGQVRARTRIDQELLAYYHGLLSQAAARVDAPANDLFRVALTMPEVMQHDQATDEESTLSWEQIAPALQQALEQVQHFRSDEGRALTEEIMSYIERIRLLLAEIDRHDPSRMENVRNRIKGHVLEYSNSEHFDPNRFEQEMIYYLEKLDISEEKVRLLNHLHYFTETVYSMEAPGKKLGFIAQEIGREINTIGSKANDSMVQRQVVEMKEELEKIKEQVLNIL
jgi:uncharacterized protein (TIGR00255 family)